MINREQERPSTDTTEVDRLPRDERSVQFQDQRSRTSPELNRAILQTTFHVGGLIQPVPRAEVQLYSFTGLSAAQIDTKLHDVLDARKRAQEKMEELAERVAAGEKPNDPELDGLGSVELFIQEGTNHFLRQGTFDSSNEAFSNSAFFLLMEQATLRKRFESGQRERKSR